MFPVTTKMSSRGQVVIPAQIRQMLRLEPGTVFLALGRGDTIVLHRFKEPPWKAFDEATSDAQNQAQAVNEAMKALKRVMDRMRRSR